MPCGILLFLLISAVSGLRWVGPQETVSATNTADWTPAPTKVPEKTEHEIFRRDLYPANLCPDYVKAYCGEKSYCAWFTDIKVVGCCSSGGSCDAVYTSCIDLRDDTPQGEPVPGVFTCTNLCYRNTFPNGYYQYGCGSTSVGETVIYTWPGDNLDVSIAILYTGGAFKEVTSSRSVMVIGVIFSETSATSEKPLSSSTTETTNSVESRKPLAIPTTVTSSPFPPNTPVKGSTSVITVAATSLKASSTTSSSASISSDATEPQLKDQSKGLSKGAKIAIGAVVGVVALVVILSLLHCHVRRRQFRKDSQQFLNPSAHVNAHQTSQYDQPVMGTRSNPTELYQDPPPVQSRGPQYHEVSAREIPQNPPPVESSGPQYHQVPAGGTLHTQGRATV
ncbi:hypothetical protein IFR05_010736 [Cadophora sp. M221]|nr:hypothetical protein IFR05_010736 [Cadophora sp. M221]